MNMNCMIFNMNYKIVAYKNNIVSNKISVISHHVFYLSQRRGTTQSGDCKEIILTFITVFIGR